MDINKLNDILPEKVLNEIPEIIKKFKIDTPLVLSHFLAQCAHESMEFKVVEENLNYSKAGLLKIFKKYFTEETATEYARKPEKIASRVYANRMGNGTEETKEGWKYRGRGFIQLTGKNNYTKFSEFVKDNGDNTVDNPELVATKYPLLSAAWFWHTNSINTIASKGSDVATITAVTRRINGGTNGLDDRIKHFNKIYSILK